MIEKPLLLSLLVQTSQQQAKRGVTVVGISKRSAHFWFGIFFGLHKVINNLI